MTDSDITSATNVTNSTLEMLVSPVMTVAVPIIYLLVFVCSTPFNLLSLVMLLNIYYKRHTPTSVFAINLSLADLLFSIFLPLQVLYHHQGNDWPWSATLCGVATTVHLCNMHCSVLTTCAIALERYCGVVRPLRTRHWRTARRATATCVLIWLLVLVVQTPLLNANLTLRITELNITTCFDVVPRRLFEIRHGTTVRDLGLLYFGASSVLFYLIPFIILVCAYIAVARGLRRSSKKTTDNGMFSRRQEQNVIGLATLCFVVCHLPTLTFQILHLIFSLNEKSIYTFYKLAIAINSLNCCFDPFVYYFASREFRKALRETLSTWCSCCSPLLEDNSVNQELDAVNKEVYREFTE